MCSNALSSPPPSPPELSCPLGFNELSTFKTQTLWSVWVLVGNAIISFIALFHELFKNPPAFSLTFRQLGLQQCCLQQTNREFEYQPHFGISKEALNKPFFKHLLQTGWCCIYLTCPKILNCFKCVSQSLYFTSNHRQLFNIGSKL